MKVVFENTSINFPQRFQMTDEEFFAFASQMDANRIERDAEGNILIMPPVGIETGEMEGDAFFALKNWAKINGGHVFGSNTVFTLPNGAVRSPDAAWLSEEKYATLPVAERKKFARVCPDLVIEIVSPSDTLSTLHEKMNEFMANGVRLGFLIVPALQQAWVYRTGRDPEWVNGFDAVLNGEQVMPGLEIPLSEFKEK